jgi:hypothetical protein
MLLQNLTFTKQTRVSKQFLSKCHSHLQQYAYFILKYL